MKIFLLDINPEMTAEWYKEFINFPEVEIVNDSFENFMDNHLEVDGVVSPANSFGLMDGGYDKAIIDYAGKPLQTKVQNIIMKVYGGYQPVGSCFIVNYNDFALLHTPTMRTPEEIIDPRIIFDCMLSCLKTAKYAQLKCIVIPAFGALTGRVPKNIVAKYMAFAYNVFKNPTEEINWGYAYYIKNRLNDISREG